MRTVEFEPTVKMSSYLVAVVIGQISKVESQMVSGGVTTNVGAGIPRRVRDGCVGCVC